MQRLSEALTIFNDFATNEKKLIGEATDVVFQIEKDTGISDENGMPLLTPKDTDLKNILTFLRNNPETKSIVESIREQNPQIDTLNVTQFMRIVLISCYKKEWENSIDKKNSEYGNEINYLYNPQNEKYKNKMFYLLCNF
jgi:hypothetical protein